MPKLPFVYRTIGKGACLYHVYQEAFGPLSFNNSGKGSRRFDPIEDINGDIIPSYYAAFSVLVALNETVVRVDRNGISTLSWSPDTQQTIDEAQRQGITQISTKRVLKLIDMNSFVEKLTEQPLSDLLKQGAAAYPQLHVYATYLAVNYPKAQGLIWDSYQRNTPGERAIVFYGDRVTARDFEFMSGDWINEPHNRDHLRDTIRSLNINIPDWLL